MRIARTRWIAAWSLVGAAWGLGLIALLSIGVYVLAVALAATVALVLVPAARREAAALLAGPALPLLYVAFLNRSGPGTVCTTSGDSESCVDLWTPWPWVVAAALFVIIGAGAVYLSRPRRSPDRVMAPGAAAS